MLERFPWLVRMRIVVRTANRIAYCEPVRTVVYYLPGAWTEGQFAY